MSINLQTIATDVQSFIGLIAPTSAAISAVAAISPAGTEFSTILNDAKGVLNAMLGVVGGIESDVEAVWPHLVSIFTALQTVKAAATSGDIPAAAPTTNG